MEDYEKKRNYLYHLKKISEIKNGQTNSKFHSTNVSSSRVNFNLDFNK